MSETYEFSAAAVVAPHPLAAAAARDVLVEGGNAIEAAVAAAAVAAVVAPARAGLLGDALWLIREPGRDARVIDARGPACAGATLARYRQDEAERIPTRGAAAILTVPGAVAGWRAALDLAAALKGRLPLGRLLDPAVALARSGVAGPPGFAPMGLDALAALPGFAEAFLDGGRWPAPGVPRPAPRLGDTLAYLAHAGLLDAARGDIAREMASDLEALGSPVVRADLKDFEARWRRPLRAVAGRWSVETPPTRHGLELALSLAILARLAPRRDDGPAHRIVLAEAQARAAALMAAGAEAGRDPAALLAPAALEAAVEAIRQGDATPPAPPLLPGEAGAFIGTVDARGLAVSLVASMGLPFGAGVLLPRTGLLANGRGAAFALWSGAAPVLRPGRRPPMDTVPLVAATRDGQVAALGSAGTAAPAMGLVLRLDRDLGAAVAAARLCPGRDPDGAQSWLAEEGFDPDAASALRRAGHRVLDVADGGFGEGGVLRRRPDGRIEAAADPRAGAAASGF